MIITLLLFPFGFDDENVMKIIFSSQSLRARSAKPLNNKIHNFIIKIRGAILRWKLRRRASSEHKEALNALLKAIDDREMAA